MFVCLGAYFWLYLLVWRLHVPSSSAVHSTRRGKRKNFQVQTEIFQWIIAILAHAGGDWLRKTSKIKYDADKMQNFSNKPWHQYPKNVCITVRWTKNFTNYLKNNQDNSAFIKQSCLMLWNIKTIDMPKSVCKFNAF